MYSYIAEQEVDGEPVKKKKVLTKQKSRNSKSDTKPKSGQILTITGSITDKSIGMY